ncbi:MAG: alanine/glycine:cation symporter family protein [Coleofasciculaceae cyanobacterium]
MAIKLIVASFATLASEAKAGDTSHLLNSIDTVFSQFAQTVFKILFFSIGGMPLIVLWLISGAIFFTFRMRFVNIWAFWHAIEVVLGKYDNVEEEGEVSHFQALSTALSATVGLGNIAGVAIAISLGGPGASFWMTLGGLFGMTSKFVECTLAQKYRVVKPDGTISGGPMYYLSVGLAEVGNKQLGKFLACMFSVLCVIGAIGGICLFQANQSYAALSAVVPLFVERSWLYGLLLAFFVGLVIVGGIQRIGVVAATIVPSLCIVYVLVACWILVLNFSAIPAAVATIVREAFSPEAVEGGFIGVMVQGLRRSTFSNEAGIGSAAIAHSAARTSEPVREGIVALLEPFIDTVLICNMTALVVVITGAYNNPEFSQLSGAKLTSAAFGTVIDWFPLLLAVSVFFFAFSTLISWSYYGERSWDYLWGEKSLIIYKVLFLMAIFLGSVVSPASVINLGDGILVAMAFPNLLGTYFLTGKVATDLEDYLHRLKLGKMTKSE